MSHFKFVFLLVCPVCIGESFFDYSGISVICSAAGTVNFALCASAFCTVSAEVRDLVPFLQFIIYRRDDRD